MAKQKSNKNGVNMSAAVRDILNRAPNTPVKEIVSSLGQRGITIHPNLVYLIKSKMKNKTRREKRQRAVEANENAGIANPVELVIGVRRLAEQAGGMKHLKKLVDLLAE